MTNKALLLLTFLLLFIVNIYGQTKKKTVSKQLEIDKLYEIYKDKSTITLMTNHGNVEAEIQIKLNAQGKPWYIIFSGTIQDRLFIKDILEELMAKAKNSKINDGFKKIDDNPMVGEVYSKGTRMVSFYERYYESGYDSIDGTTTKEYAYFSITTTESTRQDPDNTKPFRF